MNRIIAILIDRDGLSEGDARLALDAATDRLHQGHDPEEILLDEFGLEADYVVDLIGNMMFLKHQAY